MTAIWTLSTVTPLQYSPSSTTDIFIGQAFALNNKKMFAPRVALLVFISALLRSFDLASAFVSNEGANRISPEKFFASSSSSSRRPSSLSLWFPDEGMEVARKTVGWWIMGAAGSGGMARKVFPQMMDEYMELQQLKDSRAISSGETIGIGPLLGFPGDVLVEDVEEIVNNPLTVEEITQNFPVEGNFLAAKGYLTYAAFSKANADANPLAVRAVFDSFRKPKCVEPYLAQELLDTYKSDIGKIRENLIVKQIVLWLAVISLLFLLGLADLATASDLYRGWFPDWPGGKDFPRNIFTEEGNIFTIPKYFLQDIPEGRV